MLTINPRGEVVSDPSKKKTITMLSGVAGEDGKEWFAGEVHEATEPFADWMIRRGKAREGGAPKKAEK